MGATLAKHKKQKAPVMPVEWIDNPAQNAGTVVEVVSETGKADKKRRYRLHTLERMGKRPPGKGRLHPRQVMAGLKLYEVWCETQMSPAAIREIFVDGTMDADAITVAQVTAMQEFAMVWEWVPREFRGIVGHVVLEDRELRFAPLAGGGEDRSPMAQLQVALDLLANRMGY